VHDALQRRPLSTSAALHVATGLSVPTVITALRALTQLCVVREVTGRRRNRVYSCAPCMRILSEGTEPDRGSKIGKVAIGSQQLFARTALISSSG